MHSRDFTLDQPEKKTPGIGHVWFRLLIVVGSLLGVLLLVQSVVTYYRVTRILVAAELHKEAQRQVSAIGREGRRLGLWDPAEMGPLLDELRQDSPEKIAWIRVIDMAGKVQAQSGNAVGAPLVPQRPPEGGDAVTSVSQTRSTDAGTVLVSMLPLRMFRRPPAGEPGRPPGLRSAPHFVEVALYQDSASQYFSRLGSNLIVSALAALGLVASMILLWLRLPNYVRGKQLERQTELARQVQMDLLPAPDVNFENLDFAAVCLPSVQVGGDFYDVFSASHAQLAIVLGDVSGKGLPASMVVGLLLGAVRASAWMAGAAEHETSSRRLSELLRTRTSLERFASLFWCSYEPKSQFLRYVNAGHLPPMLLKKGIDGVLAVERLTEGGPVLGLLQAAEYRQGWAIVGPGDLLVLYSDGVVEAENAAGEQFNEDRLLAAIRENSDRPAAEIRDGILSRVRSFLEKEPAQDDLTLVVARFGALKLSPEAS